MREFQSCGGDTELNSISHYRILSKLGAGGMGEVYLAEDQALGRKVAIKILKPRPDDADSHRRLMREASAASVLDHPNICTIHEVGEEGGCAFLVMQYLQGSTLGETLRDRPPGLLESVEIAAQIADALTEAHSQGIIHRDIKPQNVMITDQSRVKVLDFGLAKRVPIAGADPVTTPSLPSQPGIMVGTFAYMSPEQVRGEPVDARSDIFSLGTVLYEMLARHHPFRRTSSVDTLAAIQLTEPPALSKIASIPPQLEWIVGKCLRKDKDERYSSAHELSTDLRRFRGDMEGGPNAAGQSRAVWRQRLYWLFPAAVALLALIVWRFFPSPDVVPGSVVVLPFTNETGNPEEAKYCRGIAELVTDILSGNPDITVKPIGMEEAGNAPLQVGRNLNVAAVLHGRLLEREGGKCRFWAGILNTGDGGYRATQSFDELACADIVSAQKELALRIADMLRLDLSPAQQRLVQTRSPRNDEAWRSYLDGLQALDARSIVGVNDAIDFFKRSISADQTFARAYAGLAGAYALKARPISECIPAAREAAEKALSLDESLAEAHAALAFIRGHYEWKWDQADAGFRRALELNPSYATAYQWYADLLMARGRNSEAKEKLARARVIEPGEAIIRADMVQIFFYGRNADLAIEEGKRTVDAYHKFWFAHFCLAKAYLLKGDYREAIASLNSAWELSGATQLVASHLVYAHGLSGHLMEAKESYRSLESLMRAHFDSSYNLAVAHIGLGETEQALQYLEKGVEAREPEMMYLKVDPLLDKLRGHPRFTALIQRMGLGD